MHNTGGWHDAGDYGRYIVAGTKTVMDLLLAYKKCPEKFASLDGGKGFDLLIFLCNICYLLKKIVYL